MPLFVRYSNYSETSKFQTKTPIAFFDQRYHYANPQRKNESFGDNFINRCSSMASKPPWRVFCDSVLVFFFPASFSGYFYFKVIQKLLHQERRLVRNRFISVSLILSWLLWVLTWTPKFVLGLLQLSEKPQNYTLGSILNGGLSYLVPTQTAIQILYSQMNPIMYLILLKKFGEHHTAVYIFQTQSVSWQNCSWKCRKLGVPFRNDN